MLWWRVLHYTGQKPDDPVFRSRQGGGPRDPSQVHRIVKIAAKRAGLPALVSAHWLRHAHVSHALDHRARFPRTGRIVAPAACCVLNCRLGQTMRVIWFA